MTAPDPLTVLVALYGRRPCGAVEDAAGRALRQDATALQAGDTPATARLLQQAATVLRAEEDGRFAALVDVLAAVIRRAD